MKPSQIKYFVATISAVAAVSNPALALERYRCEGEIGNGCGMTDTCYQIHDNRTYSFALDCPPTHGECTYTLNNKSDEAIRYSDMVSLNGLDMGHFIRSTQFLSFMVTEGDSYTQRWFNGVCSRIE